MWLRRGRLKGLERRFKVKSNDKSLITLGSREFSYFTYIILVIKITFIGIIEKLRKNLGIC